MMERIQIRPEEDSDRAAIYEVNRLAFGRASEARLVDTLRASEHYVPGLSLVALKGNEIVGHILFTKLCVKSKSGDFTALALAPMAVRPDLQKHGIGSGLIAEGLKACKALGYKAVIVVGHPGYYPRFGFSSARAKGLKTTLPVHDEAFMALELAPGYLDGTGGLVVYPSEFDEA